MAALPLAELLRRSDSHRALEIYDHLLTHLHEIKNNSVMRRFEVETLAGSSYALRALGRPNEAGERLTRAFALLQELKLYPSSKVSLGSVTYKTLRAEADFEAERGQIPRAIEICRKLLDQVRAAKIEPETSLEDAMDLSNLYRSLVSLDRQNAARVAELRRDLWRNWTLELPGNAFVNRQALAAQ